MTTVRWSDRWALRWSLALRWSVALRWSLGTPGPAASLGLGRLVWSVRLMWAWVSTPAAISVGETAGPATSIDAGSSSDRPSESMAAAASASCHSPSRVMPTGTTS